MGKKMDRPVPKYDDEEVASDKEVEHAVRKVKEKIQGFGTIQSIEDELEDHIKRTKVKKEREASFRVSENVKFRGAMLAESYGYHGNNFWENFAGSEILRGFNEDVKLHGPLEAVNLYCSIFGEESCQVFNYMAKNKDLLNEASHIRGIFLFETDGLQNVNTYLIEANGAGVGVAKFLGGLWDKLKAFGGPIVKKISTFVSAGAKWAKEIATKGMTWIHTNPIARIAVPVVALAGTIAGGVVLLNKLRKRAGKPKLTEREEVEFKNTAEDKSEELEKYNVKSA